MMCLHCQCVVYQSIDEIGVHIVNGAAVLSVPNETVVGEILLEVMALRYEEEEVLNDSPLTTIRLENSIYMSSNESDDCPFGFAAHVLDEEGDAPKRRRD